MASERGRGYFKKKTRDFNELLALVAKRKRGDTTIEEGIVDGERGSRLVAGGFLSVCVCPSVSVRLCLSR